MNQRETVFCSNLLDKASPTKHYKKKSAYAISQSTGINFEKSSEIKPPRNISNYTATRNPITGQNVATQPYRRIQQSGPEFKGQSLEINATGITESKKHVVKDDNIKSNKVASIDFSSIKYMAPEKKGRVNGYMNSSQMKDIMSLSEDRYYRGLVGK